MHDPPVSLHPCRTRVVIPIFNDWPAVTRVLRELGAELSAAGRTAEVLLVDDGSTEAADASLHRDTPGVTRVDMLRLRRNLGHQRAIAIGLAYIEAEAPADFVVVMDGDGEDRPSDVPRLLAAADAATGIVFAERRRRSEGLLFTALYHAYRAAHRLLTGIEVRVGNFSVIPHAQLTRLVAVSDLWNHYAAAVFKSRLPFTTVSTARGSRYAGDTQMNYAALVGHGLSAMAAFGDRIGVRLLTMTSVVMLAAAAVFVAALARMWTAGPLPAWIPFVAALALLLAFQLIVVSVTFVFVILGGRDTATFLPLRDYQYYVLDCTPLAVPHESVPVRG